MKVRQTRRVIIIGCGIAGPALGMFLRRLGIEAVVCERRAAENADEGLFLGVAPNGMNVLAELDVRAAIDAVSIPCRGFEFRNAADRTIAVIDRQHDEERFGARLQMIRRADLHRVLTDEARRRGVRLQYGRTLVRVDQAEAAGVVAHFSDGTAEAGDVLVGCDGINSATRRLALPQAAAPAYSGLHDCGGFVRCDAPIPVGVNVMVFGRRAFFGAFKTPSGEVWWFQNSGQPPDATSAPAAMIASRVLDLHKEDPAWVREVITATAHIVGPFPLNDILSMPRWFAGRVCLAGDAAHATTPNAGQGASLALEDAMVLAQCMRDHDAPEAAFAAFEGARRQRVETIVRLSRRNGSGKAVSGPVSEWLRDRLLPVFLRLGTRTQERQYAFRLEWTQAHS